MRLAILMLLAAWPAWAQAWRWSVVAYGAGQAADVISSRHAWESNPALRGPDGRMALGRTVALKSGVTGASVAVQYLVMRRWPQSKARVIFTYVNFGLAATHGAVAARNARVPGR